MDPSLRAALDDFLLDYIHTIDDGNVDAWPEFFAADATYQITTRANYEAGLPIGIMLCQTRAMMADRMLALRTANIFEPHTYCHLLGRPAFEQVDDSTVNARTNFTVIRTMQDGRTELFAAGKYLDSISITGDGPLFASRRVILDSRRVDILIVYPL